MLYMVLHHNRSSMNSNIILSVCHLWWRNDWDLLIIRNFIFVLLTMEKIQKLGWCNAQIQMNWALIRISNTKTKNMYNIVLPPQALIRRIAYIASLPQLINRFSRHSSKKLSSYYLSYNFNDTPIVSHLLSRG